MHLLFVLLDALPRYLPPTDDGFVLDQDGSVIKNNDDEEEEKEEEEDDEEEEEEEMKGDGEEEEEEEEERTMILKMLRHQVIAPLQKWLSVRLPSPSILDVIIKYNIVLHLF